MANQSMSFIVRGVGGGPGPTARARAAVLQSYANYVATRQKKKKENDDEQWKT